MPEREHFDHSHDRANREEQKTEVRQIDLFAQAAEVFDIDKVRASEDRDRVIPDQCWAIRGPQPEPAPDEHLEDAYDLSQGEGWDFNEIEQGMYDDDPSPYGGTYSEE